MRKTIRIEIEEKSKGGLFFAKSPDMKGFFDAGYSVAELEASAPIIIHDLYLAAGERVNVTRCNEDGLMFIVTPAS